MPPAASIGLGGLATGTPWLRGPSRIGTAEDGISASYPGRRGEPAGRPFRWMVPTIECIACVEGSSHDAYDVYRPAQHYRRIAADFIRVRDDEGALAFVEAWGPVRLHRLESDARHRIPESAMWAGRLEFLLWTRSEHEGRPDLIDDILEWSARAAVLHDFAYDANDGRRQLGLWEVARVIRTMGVDFVPERGLAVQIVPTTLVHIVFYALLGLYRGNARLVCAEFLASGCLGEIPSREGPGAPRKYCSEQCAWRASNRRRQTRRRDHA